MAEQRPVRILCLDGGGVRGLSSLYIVKKIMEQVKEQEDPDHSMPEQPLRPSEYFDLICGTSTGGLIAIMLGRLGYDVETAIRKYKSLAKNIFTSKSNSAEASFDYKVLEQKFRAVVYDAPVLTEGTGATGTKHSRPEAYNMYDPATENEKIRCRTFVVAVRLAGSGALCAKLRTYRAPNMGMPISCKIWEAARATSAAPTFFMPIEIDGAMYGDGATGWNNPTKEAIREVELNWPNRQIGCIISVGTGLSNPVQLNAGPKANNRILWKMAHFVSKELEFKAEVLDYCRRCLTSCERVHDEVAGNRTLQEKYFRLNVPQGMGEIQLQDWKKTNPIVSLAQDYMETADMIRVKMKIASCLVAPEGVVLPTLAAQQNSSSGNNGGSNVSENPDLLVVLDASEIVQEPSTQNDQPPEQAQPLKASTRIPLQELMTNEARAAVARLRGAVASAKKILLLIGEDIRVKKKVQKSHRESGLLVIDKIEQVRKQWNDDQRAQEPRQQEPEQLRKLFTEAEEIKDTLSQLCSSL